MKLEPENTSLAHFAHFVFLYIYFHDILFIWLVFCGVFFLFFCVFVLFCFVLGVLFVCLFVVLFCFVFAFNQSTEKVTTQKVMKTELGLNSC